MPLQPGTTLGPYSVTAKIGEGGMGEVWRAHDTKLDRDVALKVLPDLFANDPERLARFQREAKVLASLNHPNIASIYGLEEGDGIRALVLELVEGPTLADRIVQGPIAIDEALPIARQMAEALEAAHEAGVIHRDLKPANVKVKADGMVKVLDFGLAKALQPELSDTDSANSPTMTAAATKMGVIMGTAAYMSPEQAAGKPIDKRSDLWAFGFVLLEMLTGCQVFDGETVSHVIAAVLTKEPDWTAVPPSTPALICKLLRRCLEKDRKRRLDSASVARLEIEDALTAPTAEAQPAGVTASSSREARLAWLVAAGAVLAAAGLVLPAVRHLREAPRSVAAETRTEIVTPATSGLASFALSPDGREIVFVASGDGPTRLWLRSLVATTAQPLEGTDGASFPFWSPDSRSVGFFRGRPTEAPRTRRRGTADIGSGRGWSGGDVERGRRHPVCAVPDRPAGARRRLGWRCRSGDDAARLADRPPVSGLPAGRASLPLLCGRSERTGWHFSGGDRLWHHDAADRLRHCGNLPATRVAPVGPGGHARGPAAGPGPARR